MQNEEGYIQCLELALDIGDLEGAGRIMDDPDYQDALRKYQKNTRKSNVQADQKGGHHVY